MARKQSIDSDTLVLEPEEYVLTRQEARDRFVNRCLLVWGVEQFVAEKACRPADGHVEKMVIKAEGLFDLLFGKRPITANMK